MKLIRILTAITFLTMAGITSATQINNTAPSSVSGDWYYKIGGGQTISAAPHTSQNAYGENFSFNGSALWDFNASCGNFDYNLSLSNFINNIKSTATNTVNNIMGAVGGMASSLPFLILQRANPGFYDLLQNALLKAEAAFNISVKSCEDMEKDFVGGKNPFDDFVTVSKKNSWNSAKSSGGDINSAKQAIETNGGDDGIPWVGGSSKGGTGQNAIEVIKDVSFSGYNMVMDRSPTTTTSPGASGGRIAEVFQTPAAMSKFANDVLGDKIIRTCTGCQRVRSKAGKGLMPAVDKETDDVRTEFSNLVSASGNPSYADLDKISAHGIRITPKVVKALREESASEQIILLNKISSDIAISRVLEQALLLRRALHTGKNEPNVTASSRATEIIKSSLDEVNKEIENMLFESEMRKKIATNTITVLMARKSARDNNATGSERISIKEVEIKDGAM